MKATTRILEFENKFDDFSLCEAVGGKIEYKILQYVFPQSQ